MKLTDAPVGTIVVEGRDAYRVIATGFTLGVDRRLTDEQMEELNAASGAGNGNPKVGVHGRGWPRSDQEVKGSLAVKCTWTPDGPQYFEGAGYFVLFTSGHKLEPLDTFMRRWERNAWGNVRNYYVNYETKKPVRMVAIGNPKPLLPYDTSDHVRSSEPLGTDPEILHETPVTYVKLDPSDQPWIGPECDRPVVVVDGDECHYRVCPRLLVPDVYGGIFKRRDEKALNKRTKPYREQMRAALRAVANSLGAPADITVTPTSITMPLEVLEALVLGDEYGVSQVVDGVAILRDEVRIFRGEEPE